MPFKYFIDRIAESLCTLCREFDLKTEPTDKQEVYLSGTVTSMTAKNIALNISSLPTADP